MLTELAREAGAELVWASYWRNRANTWIAPRIGLPPLRFVPIPTRLWPRSSPPGQWKAHHVMAWIEQMPFVWLEDDPDIPCYLAEQRDLGQHLVVTVDPSVGLTLDHIGRTKAWLQTLQHQPRR
jgi:hypothetical protein